MIAAAWDTPYNIVYLVHIVSVILGTGMAFLAPMMAGRARRSGSAEASAVVDATAEAVLFPSFLLAGVAGGALVGMSSDIYDFGQTWLAIAGLVWLIVLVLAAAVYPPSWMRLMTIAPARKPMLMGLMHLSLAVMLVIMTWKFGTRN